MAWRTSLLPRTIYATLVANLGTLWLARGPYVTGWDLAGAPPSTATNASLRFMVESCFRGYRRTMTTSAVPVGRPVIAGEDPAISPIRRSLFSGKPYFSGKL